jgi:hypothetical protein
MSGVSSNGIAGFAADADRVILITCSFAVVGQP